MTLYKAKWLCPVSGTTKARTFHSKREADAFADLPRTNPVTVGIDRDETPAGLKRPGR